MPDITLKQLNYESDHWKRLLGSMTEANIHNKNSISRLLKDNLNPSNLADIEIFHNRFLAMDNVISVIRNDIADYDKLLIREIVEDGLIREKIFSKLIKLRDTIARVEEQCNKLKREFDNFLSANVFYS